MAKADKPTLKLIACHRGNEAGALRTAMKVYPAHYRNIRNGPLKGCMRRIVKPNIRSVFKLGNGYVLEFCITIRIKP